MNNLIIFLLSIFLAGIDPFLPAGSILIAYEAILGTDKKGKWLLVSLIAAGLTRDVLLIQRLGISSLILAICWIISAAGMTKLEKPFLISLISSAVGAGLISAVEQKNILINISATLAFTLILFFIHQIISAAPRNKIKLRGG